MVRPEPDATVGVPQDEVRLWRGPTTAFGAAKRPSVVRPSKRTPRFPPTCPHRQDGPSLSVNGPYHHVAVMSSVVVIVPILARSAYIRTLCLRAAKKLGGDVDRACARGMWDSRPDRRRDDGARHKRGAKTHARGHEEQMRNQSNAPKCVIMQEGRP